jgi:hypothetical protein
MDLALLRPASGCDRHQNDLMPTPSARRAVVSVCPAAVVEASVERVWELLTHPAGFELWIDADLASARPDGPAHAGQRMRFRAALAAGLHLPVTVEVCDVDAPRRRLRFLATLPLGIQNDQTTTLAGAGADRTLVRFG